jgi:hypothetical protein
VAIVGFAPSTMTEARTVFPDEDCEVWAINQLYVAFPAIVNRADRWFQFHHRSSYQMAIRDHDHHGWLKEWGNKFERPIYMMRREPDIEWSVEFPRDLIKKHIRPYFTNTISWLQALAELEGFEEIFIYGVDMAQDEEYKEQRPSVEYYLGRLDNTCVHSENCKKAVLRKLYVPARCDLLKNIWEYPYEDHQLFRQKIEARRKELRSGIDEASNFEQQARDARIQRIGIIDFINVIGTDPEIDDGEYVRIPREKLEQHRQQLRQEVDQAHMDEINAHDNRLTALGAIENMRYINKTWNQCANELSVFDETHRSNNETE